MKNKICLPKKLVQIFGVIVLIIGFFILVNFINKTVLLSKNALATYSCSSPPNYEIIRNPKQTCSEACGGYEKYARQQDLKNNKCCCKGSGTVTITPKPSLGKLSKSSTLTISQCVFNPTISCPDEGYYLVDYNGFCGCVAKNTKRCQEETSPIYDTPNGYLSWVEEYKNDGWRMIETCFPPNSVCDPNKFQCVATGPTGPKKLSEKCGLGSECQSGQCNTKWIDPSGREVINPIKQCTYTLIDQFHFAEKRRSKDLKGAVGVSALFSAVLLSPIIEPVAMIAQTQGLPVATLYLLNQLEKPWIKNTMASVNISSTLYAMSDCFKNGSNGEWCNMLAAVASGNPGQFSSALVTDIATLKKTFPGSTLDLALGKIFSQAKNWLNKPSAERIVTAVTEPGPPQILAYQPPKYPAPKLLPQQAKGPWPIGQTFSSNRTGSSVKIIKRTGSGKFNIAYSAELNETGSSIRNVVVKFPKDMTQTEIMALANEHFFLAKANNSLPEELRRNIAAPFGFVNVETGIGKVQLPVIENFGPGWTLGARIDANGKIMLSQIEVNKLLKIGKILDNQKIFFKDIMSNNVYVTTDGRIILFDPYLPRFIPEIQNISYATARHFTPEKVQALRLDMNLLNYELQRNIYIYEVPTSNVEAIKKMFQLYKNVIIVK